MTTKAKTYQQMANELNQLIEWFEGDQANLDEAVAKYAQATDLLKQMEKALKTAENQVKKIAAKFDEA